MVMQVLVLYFRIEVILNPPTHVVEFNEYTPHMWKRI